MLDCLPSEMYVLYFSLFLTKVLPLVNRGCYGSISVSSFLLVSPLAIFPFNRYILRWNNRLGNESIFFSPFLPSFSSHIYCNAEEARQSRISICCAATSLPRIYSLSAPAVRTLHIYTGIAYTVQAPLREARQGGTDETNVCVFFLIFIRLDFVFCELNSRIFRWFSRRDFRI